MTLLELERILDQTGEQCPLCGHPIAVGADVCTRCGDVVE